MKKSSLHRDEEDGRSDSDEEGDLDDKTVSAGDQVKNVPDLRGLGGSFRFSRQVSPDQPRIAQRRNSRRASRGWLEEEEDQPDKLITSPPHLKPPSLGRMGTNAGSPPGLGRAATNQVGQASNAAQKTALGRAGTNQVDQTNAAQGLAAPPVLGRSGTNMEEVTAGLSTAASPARLDVSQSLQDLTSRFDPQTPDRITFHSTLTESVRSKLSFKASMKKMNVSSDQPIEISSQASDANKTTDEENKERASEQVNKVEEENKEKAREKSVSAISLAGSDALVDRHESNKSVTKRYQIKDPDDMWDDVEKQLVEEENMDKEFDDDEYRKELLFRKQNPDKGGLATKTLFLFLVLQMMPIPYSFVSFVLLVMNSVGFWAVEQGQRAQCEEPFSLFLGFWIISLTCWLFWQLFPCWWKCCKFVPFFKHHVDAVWMVGVGALLSFCYSLYVLIGYLQLLTTPYLSCRHTNNILWTNVVVVLVFSGVPILVGSMSFVVRNLIFGMPLSSNPSPDVFPTWIEDEYLPPECSASDGEELDPYPWKCHCCGPPRSVQRRLALQIAEQKRYFLNMHKHVVEAHEDEEEPIMIGHKFVDSHLGVLQETAAMQQAEEAERQALLFERQQSVPLNEGLDRIARAGSVAADESGQEQEEHKGTLERKLSKFDFFRIKA
eukprot:g18559.t1